MQTLADRKIDLRAVLTDNQCEQVGYALMDRLIELEKMEEKANKMHLHLAAASIREELFVLVGDDTVYGLITLFQPIGRNDGQGDAIRDKPKRGKKEKQGELIDETTQTIDEALEGVEKDGEALRVDNLLRESLSDRAWVEHMKAGITDSGIYDVLREIWPTPAVSVESAEFVGIGEVHRFEYSTEGGAVPRFTYLPTDAVVTEQSNGLVDMRGPALIERVRRVLGLPNISIDDTCTECFGKINSVNGVCEQCGNQTEEAFLSFAEATAADMQPEPTDEELAALETADAGAEAAEAEVNA